MTTRPLIASLLLAFGSVAAHAADALTVQLDWLPGGDKAFVYAGVQQGNDGVLGFGVPLQIGDFKGALSIAGPIERMRKNQDAYLSEMRKIATTEDNVD